MNNYGNFLILGGSGGIGLEVSKYLENKCDKLYTASRAKSAFGEWIQCDFSNLESIIELEKKLESVKLDAVLYLAGTWEENAFTKDYNFLECSDKDIENVLNINLLAPIRLIQKLIPNLQKSQRGKIILIGAAIGNLNLTSCPEVSNTSSKFGLKGMVFALRQILSKSRIGITLINPGNLATEEVLNDLKESNKESIYAIPLEDLFLCIEAILKLSNRANINEIDLPNM